MGQMGQKNGYERKADVVATTRFTIMGGNNDTTHNGSMSCSGPEVRLSGQLLF
jgi:hypothetical protein